MTCLILAWPVHADEAPFEPDDHTLLLCRYDDSLRADASRGKAESTGRTKFTDGVFGKAIVVAPLPDAGFRAPTYRAQSNLDARQGTIELRVRIDTFPEEKMKWTTAGLLGVSRIDGGDVIRHFRLAIVQSSNRRRLIAWEYRDGVDQPHQMNAWIDDWEPGQWHHVAVTWRERTRRLFVDGKPVCEEAVPFTKPDFVPEATALTVGGIYPSETSPLLTARIDELRVSDIERY